MQRLRGIKDLVQETVDAVATTAEETQVTITRMPYAVLEQIGPIALPVRLIKQCHLGLTSGIYQSVRGINRLVGAGATLLIDQVEARRNAEAQALRTADVSTGDGHSQ